MPSMRSTLHICLLACLLCATLITAADVVAITCGSGIKIAHKNSGFHLASSQVAWGSGSSELAVTAISAESSTPSALWQVYSAFNPADPTSSCGQGDVITCGSTIRLKHAATNTFLRSYSQHRAPLSSKQEVSAENKGDKRIENWVLQCIGTPAGSPLTKSTGFKLKHDASGQFLQTNARSKFDNNNCRGCPILGHLEMSCSAANDGDATFTVGDGFFIPPNQERVVYDYTDFTPNAKIVVDNSKTGKQQPRDEL